MSACAVCIIQYDVDPLFQSSSMMWVHCIKGCIPLGCALSQFAASGNEQLLQVNRGNWSAMSTDPIVLMQLLHRWLQGFAEPILPVSQLHPMMSKVSSPRTTQTVSVSIGTSETQQTAERHAAVASSLTRPQRLLIARLMTCFRTVTHSWADNYPVRSLMQWLSQTLTAGSEHAGSPLQTEGDLTALQLFLTHCDAEEMCTRSMSRHHSAAVEQPNPSGLNTAAEQSQMPLPNETSDAGQQVEPQQLLASPIMTACSAQPLQQSALSTSAVLRAAPAEAVDVQTAGDSGCMWLHARIARRALGRVNAQHL